MNLGTAEVLRADSRNLPLADNSVDLVVTSPPYFALRSYQDGGEHYDGQIGAEATPDEFVTSLLEVTAECVRVLKPSGSLWVNLGDKYAQNVERSRNGNGNRQAIDGFTGGKPLRGPTVTLGRKNNGQARPKSLIGIPWRYALRCIDDLGLILRAEVIWSKPNGLPESVTDRVRRSHEQWFHFTLQPRYFSAVDEIRETYAPSAVARSSYVMHDGPADLAKIASGDKVTPRMPTQYASNPLGKLPGSVWTIPTEPLRVPDHLGVDHFAAFPTTWPRKIISAWCPEGLWTCKCGQRELLSTTSCACCGRERGGAPASQGVVLDPFGGTGATAMVAKALGRHGISVDMSQDYCRLAQWRTNDRDQLAKVLGVAKAEKQPEDQLSMFDLLGEEIA